MNRITKRPHNSVSTGLCLLLSGGAVGWLIGLSVSPVAHIVIASLVALIVSITSALAGIKITDKDHSNEPSKSRKLNVEVNPIPIAATLIGIAIGASLGIYSRTNGWLGPNQDRIARQWQQSTGLEREEISRRLFDTLYPPNSKTSGKDTPSSGGNANQSSSAAAGTNAGATTNSNSGQADAKTSSRSELSNKPSQASSNESSRDQNSRSNAVSELAARRLSNSLFTVSSEDCKTFRTAAEERLNGLLTNYRDREISDLAKECSGRIDCLKDIVRRVCPKK